MPVNPFKPGGANIHIELDKPDGPYHPGDAVEVQITLIPEKDLHIDELWCGMRGWERITTEDADGYSTTWSTVDDLSTRETIRTNFGLQAGVRRAFHLRLWIPRDAFPPAEGVSISAGWDIEAHLDLGFKRDIAGKAALPLVVPLADMPASEGEFGESSHPDVVNMRLRLPALEYIEGTKIQGELVIEPHKGLKTNQVRIQLLRKEMGHGGRVRTNHTIRIEQLQLGGKARFNPGDLYRFPFSFELPIQNCPSRSTRSTTISYILQGVLSRRLRVDYCVDADITLYGGREGGQPL
jgi:hypothetical protein